MLLFAQPELSVKNDKASEKSRRFSGRFSGHIGIILGDIYVIYVVF